MIYSLHPEARSDLRQAARYYGEHAGASIAIAFLGEFERCLSLLLQQPLLGALWFHGKRRLLLRRFPYSVIYALAPQEIRVLAVAHQSRDPDYWQKRKWP